MEAEINNPGEAEGMTPKADRMYWAAVRESITP
jgi:hypothetical protein